MSIKDRIKEHEEAIEGLRSNRYPLSMETENKINKHREIISELKHLRD